MPEKVVIAGAGASGMCAAVVCARAGAKVTIIEKTDTAGKKLSMTGNGRCNLSNTDMHARCYNQEAKARMGAWLEKYGTEETVQFFHSLGIEIRNEDGYLYPFSGQASSVADVLRKENERLGVDIIYRTQVKEILPQIGMHRYSVRTTGAYYEADSVILAMGGNSGPKITMSTGDGYYIAQKLGLHVTDRMPGLVQLKSSDQALPAEAGVRMEATITLYAGERVLAQETGELQLTANGLSGIPIMQASAYVARALANREKVYAEIDFFPAYTEEQFRRLTENILSIKEQRSMSELLEGICNSHINDMILKKLETDSWCRADLFTDLNLKKILQEYRQVRIPITETGTFQQSQVTAGGICLQDLTDELEAVNMPGIYCIGELTDVDGRCGGYNLQWAWMSGSFAGSAAAGRKRID